jgi:hypothetical protein
LNPGLLLDRLGFQEQQMPVLLAAFQPNKAAVAMNNFGFSYAN